MSTKIPVLFDLLKSRGITQKQLSDNTGISTGNISDWKSGKAAPKPAALAKIAQYLNCSVDYLLGNTDNPQSVKTDFAPETLEFLKRFERLSDEKKKALLNFLDAVTK